MIKYYKLIFKKNIKENTSKKLEQLLAFIFVLSTPSKSWYKVAYRFALKTEVIKFEIKKLIRKSSFNNSKVALTTSTGFRIAYKLNKILTLFTKLGVPFPIRTNKIIWEKPLNNNEGLILVSVHLPFSHLIVGNLLEEGFCVDAVIAFRESEDGLMSFIGTTKRIPIILSNGQVLIKAKTILNKKGCVAMMADTDTNADVSQNIFHFASRLSLKILFVFAYLRKDGIIETSLLNPPYPNSSNKFEVDENVRALKKMREGILSSYSKQYI